MLNDVAPPNLVEWFLDWAHKNFQRQDLREAFNLNKDGTPNHECFWDLATGVQTINKKDIAPMIVEIDDSERFSSLDKLLNEYFNTQQRTDHCYDVFLTCKPLKCPLPPGRWEDNDISDSDMSTPVPRKTRLQQASKLSSNSAKRVQTQGTKDGAGKSRKRAGSSVIKSEPESKIKREHTVKFESTPRLPLRSPRTRHTKKANESEVEENDIPEGTQETMNNLDRSEDDLTGLPSLNMLLRSRMSKSE